MTWPSPRSVPGLLVNPSVIRDAAEELLAVSSVFDDTGSFVLTGAQVPSWRGQAATAYAEGLPKVGESADGGSLAIRAVAARVFQHADTMERLERDREALEAQRLWLVTAMSHSTNPDAAQEYEPIVAAFDADVSVWEQRCLAERQEMAEEFRARSDVADQVSFYVPLDDPADAAISRLSRDPTPDEVAAWWRGLAPYEKIAVQGAYPELVGNLDGITVDGRDLANTVALLRDLRRGAYLKERGVLTDRERMEYEHSKNADEALGDADDRDLLVYDPGAFDGDGAVAIGVGNVDEADDVAVLVPGLNSDADSIEQQVGRAENIREASGDDDAVIAWIGYDAPDNWPTEPGDLDALKVIDEDLAIDGGKRLDDFVDGLRAARDDDQPHLTAIGHSYGSTVTGHALRDHGLDVDDVAFVGSPGVGRNLDHAGQTGLDPSHVFAGAESRDPVTRAGNDGWWNPEFFGLGLGDNPVADDFGAVVFDAESNDGPNYPDLSHHSSYFDPGSVALENLGAIVDGRYDDVQQ